MTEDLTPDVDQQRDRQSPSGTQPIVTHAFMGGGLDMGVMYTIHTPNNPKLLMNTETLLVTRLQGVDLRLIGTLLGTITVEQAQKARSLQRGELIARVPSVFDQPVYGGFDPLPLPRELTEAERLATAKAFLQRVTTRRGRRATSAPKDSKDFKSPPGVPSQGIDNSPLTPEQVKIMMFEGTPLTKLYGQIGIDRPRGRRAVKGLTNRGFVQPHTFTTGRRGGAISVLEVTKLGWEVLQGAGLKQPKPLHSGGWEHDWSAELIRKEGTRQGEQVRFQVDLQEVRLDVEWRNPFGKATYFNIGISNPKREVDNALKAIQLPVVRENSFVLVCRDVAFAKAVKASLKKKDPGGTLSQRIGIRLIADFLDSQSQAHNVPRNQEERSEEN